MKGMLNDGASGLGLIKSSVRSQPAYSLKAHAARRKLNQNESPYDVPPEIKREILDRAAASPWHRYPEFAPPALLEQLAAHYGWRADGILVGNGSNELIQATLATTLETGDRVVAPTPTFSLYRLLTNVFGGCYVPVALGGDFRYNVESLIEVAVRERAKVIVLNSPNNPTGSVLPEDGVDRVLEATDAMVICDEAYQDFGGPSALRLLSTTSRVVVLRTFSKAMGLAGLRFGLALAHPVVAREIAKGKLPYNVNLVTLTAASVLLGHGELYASRVREIVETRDRTLGRLRAIDGITVFPSAANFFLIRSSKLPARELFRRLLEEHGILVRDVSASAELNECLRISVGTPEDMDAVIEAMQWCQR
jgi:histidinol-phosphate aminotransferase